MTVPASPSSSLATADGGLLAARQLGCRRGRRLLFRGVDLALAPGSVTWLRGTNGSGKTSLMRILAGLAHAAEGEVTWNGMPLARAGTEARSRVLYIGHTNALKDDLSLAEAVAFHAALAELDRPAERAQAAIETLRLAPWRNSAVRTLSQGQRRRGALARLALDDAPRAWILDEPFDALDAASVALLVGLVEAHAARGGAVLLTSHQTIPIAGANEFDLEPARVQ
jgi:heme exporter protein A